MTHPAITKHRIVYVTFCIPFIVAGLTWIYLPTVAEWVVQNLFHYVTIQHPNFYWYLTIRVFFSWYTFLAIGIAGAWIIAAAFSRRKYVETNHSFYPFVSFVVPAYNQEQNISGCIISLLECIKNYEPIR